ncbi:hypothetical protein A2U01_0000214 [Trifolium medium]|uniref:Uncharacterized protein n=1 Tax=Trifolium medium TaxID=97028 RepID=A0A392LX68_9FABA|nr:hypothetical protein [Trifolium medium]
MGNACFGKKRSNKGSLLHPLVVHRVRYQAVTIKVDTRDDNSELGHLIVQECSKGRLRAQVVATATDGDHDHSYELSSGRQGLRPIPEHSEEDIVMYR